MANPDPKPVFITGATGSVGYALATRLSEAGQKVRAIARNPEKAGKLSSLFNVEVVAGDLSQPKGLEGLMEGCGLVYHVAAKVQGSDRASYMAINVTGTQAILAEAIRARVDRFILVSTIGVYGLADAADVKEDKPWVDSTNPYIHTKQAAEKAAWEASNQIDVSVARPGDVYGPGQYAWTVQFIEKINQGLLMPPSDSASGMFNLVYIDNLVDALILLGSHPKAVGQAFNVVDGEPMRVSDYIRRLAKMVGKNPPAVPAFVLRAAAAVIMAGDRLRGREAMVTPASMDFLLHHWNVNNEKLRNRLGWIPRVSREEAFRRIEAWLRANGYIKPRPASLKS